MAEDKTKQPGGQAPSSSPSTSSSSGGQSGGQQQQSGGGASVSNAPRDTGGGLSGAERDRRIRTGARGGTATDAMGEEYERLGVDVRLDNRVGDQRPVLNPVLKPQQFDGPEVGHFGEHADEAGDEFAEAIGRAEGDTIGMRSLGPLGRGEDGDEADQPVRSRAELNR